MTWLRGLLKSDAVHAVTCWLASLHIRLVFATSRWRTVGAETPRPFWDGRRPFILCFWHGRLLMMPYCWDRRVPIHMLISRHRDGQIIARTVAHFGIDTVSGSSSKGGSTALRAMVRLLKSGHCVGITPDGPRGPRMRANMGIVNVARLSGAPVVPVSFAASPRRLLSSWDRFLVAWPFGRGVFVWGEPIAVPHHASESEMEAARLAIEDRLNAVTQEADRLSGHEPVEPEPEGAGVEPAEADETAPAGIPGAAAGPRGGGT
ncbi:MAG: lysophospholipid acyltransferase family protein [Alphaproteobacteria bacterium]